MDALLKEFLEETRETLQNLEFVFAKIEADPADADALAEIFRGVHMIKGSAGFIPCPRIEETAHEAETLLDAQRKNRTPVPAQTLETVKSLLGRIEYLAGQTEAEHGITAPGQNAEAEFWTEIERFVKRSAQQDGKSVNVTVSGQNIAIPAAIRKKLKNPLLQLLRNAVAHGIEPPEKRREKGKDKTGHIAIAIHKDEPALSIRVTDDGRGIDAAHLPHIFDTGFTTSEKASVLAGRGVGLDIVKNEIEDIGGHIEVSSQSLKETSFIIRIDTCGKNPL